jgi:flagellar protein FlaG
MEGSKMKIESMDAAIRPTVDMASLVENKDSAKKAEKAFDGTAALQEKVSEAFIQKAVDKANDTFKVQNRSLEFKIHERTKEIIVKIIDRDTKEVIREIPPEKMLDMFASMLEFAGLLVDEKR